MRISELAQATGVSVRALRHYGALGLLTPQRMGNRYRVFAPDDVQRVRLIRLFLSVGFQLQEIRDYAPCWQETQVQGSTSQGSEVQQAQAFYQRKLSQLDAQLSDLQAVRQRLAEQLQALSNPSEETP